MNKRTELGILVAIVVLLGGAAYYSSKKTVVTVETSPTATPAIGKEITYNGEVGKTALELLQATHTVELNGAGTNAYVVGIDGVKADDSKKEYWSFIVNGTPASVGAGSYQSQSTDVISWKIANF